MFESNCCYGSNKKKSKSSIAFLNLKSTFSNFLISFNISRSYLSLMMLGIYLLVGKRKRIRKRKTRVATLTNTVSDTKLASKSILTT